MLLAARSSLDHAQSTEISADFWRMRPLLSVMAPLLSIIWTPGLSLAAESAAPPDSQCSKAVSIYAMQKTGSTFLAKFSRDIALHRKMCRTYQNNKEYICQATLYVDCPRNSLHRKTVSLERTFSTQLQSSTTEDRRRKCNGGLRRKLLDEANDWLRSTDVTVKYRYNRSLSWLLMPDGFVRGPLRQLYTEYELGAVPYYPRFHNVIIVHTRHPVEMMVSSYYCIADPKVCPVRNKFLGTHVPKNDTISSVDAFVLRGIARVGSTPHSILRRNEMLSAFMRGFGHSKVGMARSPGCHVPTLVHSKYEMMVTNFSTWAQQILSHIIAGKGQRRTLHTSLVNQYQGDFVPNGKHKHALLTGANIAKLKESTIRNLMHNSRLQALLNDLGYDWFGRS